MTQAELYAAWERYMHRKDLSEDLDLVYTLVTEQVQSRLMFEMVSMSIILQNTPRMLLHAGLTYLAELAQDDEQLQREQLRFEQAAQDFSMRYSIDNTVPVMIAPQYQEGPFDAA